jgi:type I restriction enzyme S subunit
MATPTTKSTAVRPGYKQTEVGVIPENWEAKQLGEIGEALIGLTYKPADVRDHGTLVLRSSNIQNDRLEFHDNVYVVAEIPERIRVREGDVLVCVRNGSRELIGKAALLDKQTAGMTFGAFMAVYRSPIGKLASYLFQSAILKRQINEHLGATINQITNKSLVSFRIPYPSVEVERNAIADALSDANALIESLEALIAKKRDLKQAAMQQLLTGKKRLPGFTGEWEEKELGRLGQFLKGSGVTKGQTHSGNLACVRYGELYTHHNDVIRSFYSWISPQVALTATRLRKGDILFAGSGETKEEIGKCAAFISDVEAYAGGDIVILRTLESDPVFLGYFLNTALVSRQKSSRGQGDAVVHISKSALATIRLCVPPPVEQTAIAEVLNDMDAEIEALEAKLIKARQIKQGMMQELLTGRIRLV